MSWTRSNATEPAKVANPLFIFPKSGPLRHKADIVHP
jgi:hypothetical protein